MTQIGQIIADYFSQTCYIPEKTVNKLEKPEAMKTKKTIFLLAGLMYCQQLNKTITFREITSGDELEKAFRFRYEEYSKCRLNVFLKRNEHQLDMDIFDLHSHHYGLFGGDNEMIGYMRVVLDRGEYQNTRVMEIGTRYGFYIKPEQSAASNETTGVPDYPFLSYEEVPGEVMQFYHALKEKKEKVLEASRLILSEHYRGLKNISFLVECVIALYPKVYSGYKHAMADCVKEHAVFYRRYGFTPVEQGSGFNVFDLKRLVTCLSLPLSMASIPSHLHLRFDEMAFEYKQTGRITRYSA